MFSFLLGIVSGQYPLEESGGPLSQMNEAVNNIDRPSKQDNSSISGTSSDSSHLNVKVSSSDDNEYYNYNSSGVLPCKITF